MNPANLAFMPGGELRWSSMFLNESRRRPIKATPSRFAFPIPFLILATGLRLDCVSIRRARRGRCVAASSASDYQWLTWGLAFRPCNTFALGLLAATLLLRTSERVTASVPWSLGLTSRP